MLNPAGFLEDPCARTGRRMRCVDAGSGMDMRRGILVLALLVAGLSSWAFAQADVMSLQEYEALRAEALGRRRRIIFNSDGADAVTGGYGRIRYDRKTRQPGLGEQLLSAWSAPLAGTHVDSIFYCSSRCFGYFLHRTETGAVRPPIGEQDIVQDLIAQGTCPLQVHVAFGKENGMEVFFSMRMNDTHDATNPQQFPPLKEQNPDYLLGEKGKNPPHGRWSSVDYAHPEVREWALRFFEEVCRNFEVDGIELDFFRHPVLFRHAAGQPVGERELDMMTALVRSIRRMTEEVGREKGRAILVAVRVPDSVAYCRAIGLDLETWLSEGLIDIMTVSGYFRLNPWSYSAGLGRKHGVKVYAGLSETRVGGGHHAHAGRASDESYRARAMSAWASGMDGIYTFNLFDTRRAVFSQMGDPKAMQGLDRAYYLSVRGGRRGAGNPFPIQDFINVAVVNPDRPLQLRAGATEGFEMVVGPIAQDGLHADDSPAVRLKLLVSGGEGSSGIEVMLNGRVLEDPVTEAADSGERWLVFWAGETLREGVNTVEVTADLVPGAQPRLRDVLLTVRYPPEES